MPDAVIFDLDGTLCDVSGALHHLEGEEPDFEAFASASTTCPPRDDVVVRARAARDAGRLVLVVTGRSSIWRDPTLDWLARHDVPYDRLLMRWSGDFRPDVAVKKDVAKRLAADDLTVVEAWDDKPAVLEVWAGLGAETHHVA